MNLCSFKGLLIEKRNRYAGVNDFMRGMLQRSVNQKSFQLIHPTPTRMYTMHMHTHIHTHNKANAPHNKNKHKETEQEKSSR